ncbi:DNA repair protein RadA [Vibrio crassostreae]|uniref:DNA repair protein RadA n=1 Tax=Vibrio crassostreae TaxID=246167 RepID=UPI001B317B94|nr:DNA repair protein RadA [Vibrio crassostreae]
MAKTKVTYACNECGADFPRWQGQCNMCAAWNTITEHRQPANVQQAALQTATKGGYSVSSGRKAFKFDEIDAVEGEKILTGIGELDRVLGDGMTIGSVILITGDPGAGKTTLLSKFAEVMSHKMVTLYNTAEESLPQFKIRADNRMKLSYNKDKMFFSASSNLEDIIGLIEEHQAKMVFVDSIQAISSDTTKGDAGGVAQVKACASMLNVYCKTNNITLVLIGHVTKDSSTAGPKTLEHVIDASIHIDVGEALRTLRAKKNRFGDTDQVGLFQMTEKGMRSVDNPSEIFLSSSSKRYSGSAITCIRDGARNLLLEVQALVSEVGGEKPMRNTIGINYNRLNMITAVLSKCGGIKLFNDININLVGGMKLPESETSTDLALAAALVSSINDKPIPNATCFFGEISLTGEIRPVAGGVPRVIEAAKHGMKDIFIPKNNFHKSMLKDHPDLNITQVEHISDLIKALK